VLLAVAAGGVAGTLLRAALEELLPHHAGGWPWGTFVANLAGAFVLGLVARRLGSGPAYALLGAGVCGSLTTFSTIQLQVYDLLDGGHAAVAAGYLGATVAVGLAAVVAGDRVGARA
jgi:CrcB protein